MLEKLLHLYTTSMKGRVYNLVPHLWGPPGCGKSTFVKQLAELMDVCLHTINVSRLSPLELEGVQMPSDDRLNLLLATYWNDLQEGDVVFLDEFLRGFPEVYNGLLDIITSREVAGHKLPNVFFIAASNSTVAYDPALTDRLLHLPVPDIRRSTTARKHLAQVLIRETGMHPDVEAFDYMDAVLSTLVEPMYHLLDDKPAALNQSKESHKARSLRHIAGLINLRYVNDATVHGLLHENNRRCEAAKTPQHAILYWHRGHLWGPPDRAFHEKGLSLRSLTPQQRAQIELNIELLDAREARKEMADEDD